MKTVKATETHKRILKVMGTLQAKDRKREAEAAPREVELPKSSHRSFLFKRGGMKGKYAA
jgi:hypothetical protein